MRPALPVELPHEFRDCAIVALPLRLLFALFVCRRYLTRVFETPAPKTHALRRLVVRVGFEPTTWSFLINRRLLTYLNGTAGGARTHRVSRLEGECLIQFGYRGIWSTGSDLNRRGLRNGVAVRPNQPLWHLCITRRFNQLRRL